MCNITKKTNKETIIVYKAVIRVKKRYYACFSGIKIKVGKVKPQTNRDYNRIENRFLLDGWRYDTLSMFYNKNMVGKTSGFATLKSAESLAYDGYGSRIVLKIVLGGEIWRGNAVKISSSVPDNAVVYAGTEILSFEEVK
jgi:hypothetical protein